MNELIEKEANVENMIYEVRGVQVMLSSDVAILYATETKRVNETIKRNINRFPESFCFQLTDDEIEALSSRSQFATLNKSSNNRGYNLKYMPYVLTEQGVMMLSGLLKSDIAAKTNIRIINAFVKMRKYISNNLIEQKYINDLVLEDHDSIKLLQETFSKLEEKQKVNSIFFEGQIFDSYICLMEILSKAKEEVIIIDNYVSLELLKIIKDINVKVIFVSKNIDDEMIKKYKAQYNNFEGVCNNSFHDRFIIIDRKILYHSGASFKDLGNKCFAITLIDDSIILNDILQSINM